MKEQQITYKDCRDADVLSRRGLSNYVPAFFATLTPFQYAMNMLLLSFALFLFARPMGLSAAMSPTDQQVGEVIERIIAEEAGSDTLCAVSRLDLDGDGGEEAVFTFVVGSHGSQVRAIQWKSGKPVVLFANGSSTPNTDFVRVRGVPTIVLERSDYEPDYVAGKRTRQLYPWNGTTFAHAPADDCLLEDRSVMAQDGSSLLEASDAHCEPLLEPIPNVGCSEF